MQISESSMVGIINVVVRMVEDKIGDLLLQETIEK